MESKNANSPLVPKWVNGLYSLGVILAKRENAKTVDTCPRRFERPANGLEVLVPV